MSQPGTATLYGAVDLGSLGQYPTWGWDINDGAQIAGVSVTPSGEMHPFLWEDGVMTDLATDPDVHSGCGLTAPLLNNAGQVSGTIGFGSFCRHAYLYENGVITDITPTVNNAWVNDINEVGQVVGWVQSTPQAFLWDGSALVDLTPPGVFTWEYASRVYTSEAVAINDVGQVVVNAVLQNGRPAVFLWESGAFTYIAEGTGRDINEVGQVAGSKGGQAFLWSAGTLTYLFPDHAATVTGLNDAGQAVGVYNDPDSFSGGVFLWDNGVVSTLPRTVDRHYSTGGIGTSTVLNNAGQVVAISFPAGGDSNGVRGLLWDTSSGTVYDLGSIVPTGINEGGQVVANTLGPVSPAHAFLVEAVTPQEMTGIIIGEVDDLVDAGSLTPGQGTSLQRTIEAAGVRIAAGNIHAACGLLDAFIAQVGALEKAQRLTTSEIAPLIDGAKSVRAEVGCS